MRKNLLKFYTLIAMQAFTLALLIISGKIATLWLMLLPNIIFDFTKKKESLINATFLITSLLLILVAYYISKDFNVLWALILTAGVNIDINDFKIKSKDDSKDNDDKNGDKPIELIQDGRTDLNK